MSKLRPGLMLATAVAFACGARSGSLPAPPDTPTPDASPPQMASALVLNECGPADGAAVSLLFSPDALACPSTACQRGSCPPDPMPATRDVISLYSALPAGPTTLVFDPGGPNGAGQAMSCVAGACVNATSVELVLTSPSAAAPTSGVVGGHYLLHLADGSTKAASFTAAVCGNLTFCG